MIDTNIKPNRGRRPADAELATLGQMARDTLRLTSEEGEEDILKARVAGSEPIKGCSQMPGDITKGLWSVKFYLAGGQRFLGRMKLNEAARLYDALLVHFEGYRSNTIASDTEGLWFNFSREHARRDIGESETLRDILGMVEKIFLNRGLLVSRADRHEKSRVARAERAKKRTFSAQFSEGLVELRTHVFELVGELEKVNAELKAVNKKLDNSKPACHVHGTPFETAPVSPDSATPFS